MHERLEATRLRNATADRSAFAWKLPPSLGSFGGQDGGTRWRDERYQSKSGFHCPQSMALTRITLPCESLRVKRNASANARSRWMSRISVAFAHCSSNAAFSRNKGVKKGARPSRSQFWASGREHRAPRMIIVRRAIWSRRTSRRDADWSDSQNNTRAARWAGCRYGRPPTEGYGRLR
jgi:hypothetical protein